MNTNKNEKSAWARLVERCLPTGWRALPAADVEKNTEQLKHLKLEDPAYKCFLDHQFDLFSNSMEVALDLGDTRRDDVRLRHLNEARAHARVFLDLEARRTGWAAEAEKVRKAESRKQK